MLEYIVLYCALLFNFHTLYEFRVAIFMSRNAKAYEKDLKDNKDNSLHLGRKYARIFVLGHFLFLASRNRYTVREQISVHIFAPNEGYCLFNYNPSNIFARTRLVGCAIGRWTLSVPRSSQRGEQFSERKTVSFEEQIMSVDKYTSIFSKSNGGYCVNYSSNIVLDARRFEN